MIDFIVKNYQFIALVVAALVDVILLLVAVCRKKVNPSLDEVLVSIPDFIRYAEEKFGSGNGDKKKDYVMGIALSLYKHITGFEVSKDSHIYKVISGTIENVLKTPQKKG